MVGLRDIQRDLKSSLVASVSIEGVNLAATPSMSASLNLPKVSSVSSLSSQEASGRTGVSRCILMAFMSTQYELSLQILERCICSVRGCLLGCTTADVTLCDLPNSKESSVFLKLTRVHGKAGFRTSSLFRLAVCVSEFTRKPLVCSYCPARSKSGMDFSHALLPWRCAVVCIYYFMFD